MDLETIGFLKDGKYRKLILGELNKSPALPSELADKLQINRASISRILKDLKERELIDSVSSNSRTVIYRLTKKGKDIAEKLFDKHYTIKKFMRTIIRHNEDNSEKEASKIFHHLSNETIEVIGRLMEGKPENKNVLKPSPGYIG